MTLMRPTLPLILLACGYLAADDDLPAGLPLPAFERIVIDDDFPGGYQVEVADVDGDGRPDIVALGGGTCAWYENPSWQKRIITGPDRTPGIISSAALDIDGDGRAEVAIAYDFAMREPARGKLGIATAGRTADAPWSFRPIADVPSIHRVRWGDVLGDGRPDLVVAPIFGPNATAPEFQEDVARLQVYPSLSLDADGSPPESVAEAPVMHAIAVVRLPGDDRDSVLSADNLGVALHRRLESPGPGSPRRYLRIPLVPGAPGRPPARGASEVHLGRLGDRHALLATVEPWHGSTVAVYVAPLDQLGDPERAAEAFGPRVVLDDSLIDGHALWLADVNGDGIDEVFAGHRGEGHRLSAYSFTGDGWIRTVLDTEIAPQDLRGGDLTGDGQADVVAIGGSSRNLVWYRFKRGESPDP